MVRLSDAYLRTTSWQAVVIMIITIDCLCPKVYTLFNDSESAECPEKFT